MPLATYPETYAENSVTKYISAPSRPISEGCKTNALKQEFESGHEQRRQKGDPRKTFEFSYNALTEKESQTLFDFFIQQGGPVKSFLWTHPTTKVQYQVRFDQDTFQREMFAHSPGKGPIYKLSVKLIQVL